MRRCVVACLFALALAVPAQAQTYFPFGAVAFGTASSGIRPGPIGCYVHTADPTFSDSTIGPCSLTVAGRIRVDPGPVVVEPGADPLEVEIVASSNLPVEVQNGSLADANSLAMVAVGASALSTIAGSDCVIVSAASTNATNCKASAGNLYGFELYNTSETVYYLRLYNLAASPTCSSATGFIRSIPVPPAAAAGKVGSAITPFAFPVNYSAGIGFCITAGSSSTDNTNAATGIFGVLKYK